MKRNEMYDGMEVAYTVHGNADSRWNRRWLVRGRIIGFHKGLVEIRAMDKETGQYRTNAEGEYVEVAVRSRAVYSEWTVYADEMAAEKQALADERARQRAYDEWFEKNRAELLAVLAEFIGIEVADYYVERSRYHDGLKISLTSDEVEELIATIRTQGKIAAAAVMDLVNR